MYYYWRAATCSLDSSKHSLLPSLVFFATTPNSTDMLRLKHSTRLARKRHRNSMSVLSLNSTATPASTTYRYNGEAMAPFSTRSGMRNVIWASLGAREFGTPYPEYQGPGQEPAGISRQNVYSNRARQWRKVVGWSRGLQERTPKDSIAQAALGCFNEINPFDDPDATNCIVHHISVGVSISPHASLTYLYAAHHHLDVAEVIHAELNSMVVSMGRTMSPKSRESSAAHLLSFSPGEVACCSETRIQRGRYNLQGPSHHFQDPEQ